MKYRAKGKTSFWPKSYKRRTYKAVVVVTHPTAVDVLIEFYKNCYNYGNNRAKFLPLLTCILYGMPDSKNM